MSRRARATASGLTEYEAMRSFSPTSKDGVAVPAVGPRFAQKTY
jgi:hypothetical protein